MVKVTLGDKVLAESDNTEVVEGNHYFPPDSVKKDDFFTKSPTSTICPWKGTASYYSATVDGKTVTDIAWYYPEPKKEAEKIKDYIAFYKTKVKIE